MLRIFARASFLLPFIFAAHFAFAVPPGFIWIEGEKYASLTLSGKPVNVSDWGKPAFLSGGKWLHISLDAADVEKTVPPDGIVLSYDLSAPAPGNYALWNRVGYEFARSPFEWRVDEGAWQTTKPDALTTDLMELSDWNEVAWLKLGQQTLAVGPHKLQIRLTKTQDDKGKTVRILYASDALCLTTGDFSPNNKYKPDETEPLDAAPTQWLWAGAKAAQGGRQSLFLGGVWEICRDDEPLPPPNIAVPMGAPPKNPHWKSITVPGDKNVLRPDLLMAHRVWYRTKITVPSQTENTPRSYVLTFGQNNLNTTVYVNGVLCGFNKNPFASFDIDVTKGIKPGEVNEIWVGIRDAWYGYSTSPTDPMKLRRKFNIPVSAAKTGFQDLAYPIWNGFQSGILATPTLTIAGQTRVSDAFCKPSVANKTLTADVTVANNAGVPVSGQIVCEAVRVGTNNVEKTFAPAAFTCVANGETTVTVSEKWESPALWWPDANPALYRFRARVVINNQTIDVSDTTFGFREWGVSKSGRDFTLNGVVWRIWADLNGGQAKTEWLQNYRASHQRTMRLMGVAQQGTQWMGLTPNEALQFFDENGVVVRRCGPLDGEMIGYNALENDADLRKLYNSPLKMDLMENWRDQMVAQVKGERNHPSVMLWSIENEWLFINCINLYRDKMDEFEREVQKCSDAVRVVDPTRLTMTDGGGAGKNQTMPVHGTHYMSGNLTQYPALAYQTNPDGGGRDRWVWDGKRPRFVGEDFFATGINPAEYAAIGGEETFGGKAASREATGLMYRILTEGYRWANQSAWQFWVGAESATNQYNSQSEIALFCREWDSAWASGQKPRTLSLFNDTHDERTLQASWSLVLGGKPANTQTKTVTLLPGTRHIFAAMVPVPVVKTRQAGQWILTVRENEKEVFRDVKTVSVLPNVTPPPNPLPEAERGRPTPKPSAKRSPLRKAAFSVSPSPLRGGGWGEGLAVYDPEKSVAAYLTAQKTAFLPVASLEQISAKATVLLVGKNALTPEEAASSRLAAWASGGSGRRVVVLEQKNPLKYQALPAEMEAAQNEGSVAFPEDPDHPVFRGLKAADFFTWAGANGSETVYRNAYQKPTRGAKSLVQCDKRLNNSALVEIPVGKNGLLLVSQLLVGEDLKTSPVARLLLSNLIDYAQTYKQAFRPVFLVQKDADKLPGVLSAAGVRFQSVPNAAKAFGQKGAIVAMEATPANLKTLTAQKPMIDAWTKSGGFLLLFGLTPDGLRDYNALVGVNHLIRPFRRERVGFSVPKNPLLAGLSTGDIALSSGERINNYSEDEYMAPDVFSYVVDYDEVAPFAKIANGSYWGLKDTSNDHNPYNIVNGFTNADSWKLTFMIWAGGGTPTNVPLEFPTPQEIQKIEWVGNTNYLATTKIALQFDNAKKAEFETLPNGDAQTFSLPPGYAGKNVLLSITDWEKNGKTPLVGIDNIRLWAKRTPAFYSRVKPMLTSGAMMEYKQGAGGIVLCNVLFQEGESVPANQSKKQNIVATLLRNLHAPLSGETRLIAGAANLRYTPVDLSKFANQYRNERGWFGDKETTFADLPTRRQSFAGVGFDVYDFPTSPVPNAVMLGGDGVPGNLPEAVRQIPVNQKADALFFLQAARMDNPRSKNERNENKRYEMAHYIVRYADNQTATVPVYAEINVDNYKQDGAVPPRALSGAQIAWTKVYEGGKERAVAYVQQWDNPRPDAVIQSVDLEYGPDRRGVPVLLGLTAAAKQ